MKKHFFLLLMALFAARAQTPTLAQKIGTLFMIGFEGTHVDAHLCKEIADYGLGGVILFDVNPIKKGAYKNIASKAQVKQLTSELQRCSGGKLLIAVDQEGGRVQRLKSKYGFYGKFPSAHDTATLSDKAAQRDYLMMAKELKEAGINYDLAPVVDLDINLKNHVIHGLKRSFGADPKKVAHYASLFIDAMHRYGILTSLKHFPGHGSSTGDTHKGFVDVTKQWQEKELMPYRLLADKADTVMVAHVFNRRIDPAFPATLSRKTVTGILRERLGFDGVTITDDLQMGAIAKKYTLKETIRRALEAGNDILLFGNQLSPNKRVSIAQLVATVETLLKEGKLSKARIEESYRRIQRLKERVR